MYMTNIVFPLIDLPGGLFFNPSEKGGLLEGGGLIEGGFN